MSGMTRTHGTWGTQRLGTFHVCDGDNLAVAHDANVRGFTRFGHELAQMRPCHFIEIQAREGRQAEFEDARAEPVFTGCYVSFDVAAGFEHHDEPMGRTLMQAQFFGQLRDAMGRPVVGENVEYLKGPIQNLTAINFGSSGWRHRKMIRDTRNYSSLGDIHKEKAACSTSKSRRSNK